LRRLRAVPGNKQESAAEHVTNRSRSRCRCREDCVEKGIEDVGDVKDIKDVDDVFK